MITFQLIIIWNFNYFMSEKIILKYLEPVNGGHFIFSLNVLHSISMVKL